MKSNGLWGLRCILGQRGGRSPRLSSNNPNPNHLAEFRLGNWDTNEARLSKRRAQPMNRGLVRTMFRLPVHPRSRLESTRHFFKGRSRAPRVCWRAWSVWSVARMADEAGLEACSSAPDHGVPWALVCQLLVGLPIALWTWKCLMLVLFQRRLIYMPYFPPGSRTQELDPADPLLQGLAVRTLSFPPVSGSPRLDGLLLTPSSLGSDAPDGLIFYLQGNAGNTLARLPVFRELLLPPSRADSPRLGLFALSPRGYWTSGGPLPFPLTALTPPGYRQSQTGMVRDYLRVLEGLRARVGLDEEVPVWVHGHSLGGAAAAQLLAKLEATGAGGRTARARVAGLILENPLPSVPQMVKVLYPSKWLPYHYLGPLALDRWHSAEALQAIDTRLPILFIQSQLDELVPPSLTRDLYDLTRSARLSKSPDLDPRVAYSVIPHALHDNAFSKSRYRLSIHQFISGTMPSRT
ncbi:hypothetical protein PTTG_25379 [Puccinia triticina 1-1 BBBD Race 1]|uniref:AB hydrolase-1 domain-containing protein n=1 Tax=Puccinia triticina (isolate 1-1 / race 1 (BBBD)) TaxID=630390 RepID=A0A180H3Q7_PUCT1|nr:hypothetical protein PTTG_25379 [Puccinia triticina 1-1 BBBD Race 1]